MKKFGVPVFVSILLQGILLLPTQAQQASAPVYKDGDWWKVKVTLSRSEYQSTTVCQDLYPEYVVKIEQGNPQAYGLHAGTEEKIDCPNVLNQVLGTVVSGVETPEPLLQYLKFPLQVGQTWSSTFQQKNPGRKVGYRNININYKVISFEKVRTAKGEFDAFKIEASGWQNQSRTIHYAPQIKAIVHLNSESESRNRTVALQDFQLAQ
ncbi:MAG TPA: hypothetical protein VNL14_17410 [Candidatus Acidoferrales bacterium]|nr:hypothetical protein [Candidatus Acidoferrales bacterium]